MNSSKTRRAVRLKPYCSNSIIAPSFGGIYYNNCFRNGVLPIDMDIENVRSIAGQMAAAQGHARVMVDLETQTVFAPDGSSFRFLCASDIARHAAFGRGRDRRNPRPGRHDQRVPHDGSTQAALGILIKTS